MDETTAGRECVQVETKGSCVRERDEKEMDNRNKRVTESNIR